MRLLISLVIFGLVFIWPVVAYNRLVKLRQRFRNAFSQIDVQLKRRYDLIPNLVETVKGYLKHERETLEAVIAARNVAQAAARQVATSPENAGAMSSLISAEQGLGGALGRLLAVSESYPELKADQGMKSLQEELASTENRVSFARQAYNDSVMGYNTYRESFPQNQIAGMFGFKEAPLFEIEIAAEREAPRVSFS